MLSQPITLLPYARRYRRDLLRLIQDAQDDQGRLHVHLDWTTVDEWIGEPGVPIYLAWSGARLLGAIAASPPLGKASWLRMLVVGNNVDPGTIIPALWTTLYPPLLESGVTEIGALTLKPWLEPFLESLGFVMVDHIVTLRRQGMHIPDPMITGLQIHHVNWRDVPQVIALDHAAFDPVWQLSQTALRQASREATSFTVAELNHQWVGYQLSTVYRDGAHLARLAVIPAYQGSGVGGVLLGDMIHQFLRRGILSATVNTQRSNIRSQHLYEKYDFRLTGLSTPMWLWKTT